MAEKTTHEALEQRIRELEREISKGQGAQDAVRQSESKYRTLVEHLPQRVFYKDRPSVYVSCNENCARDLTEGIKGRKIMISKGIGR